MGKTAGTAVLSCRKHPDFRWVHTKYVHPDHKGARPFMGRGVLMFEGEVGGKPASPFNLSERSLAEHSQEFADHYRKSYTPECNCSIDDLVFLMWTDE